MRCNREFLCRVWLNVKLEGHTLCLHEYACKRQFEQQPHSLAGHRLWNRFTSAYTWTFTFLCIQFFSSCRVFQHTNTRRWINDRGAEPLRAKFQSLEAKRLCPFHLRHNVPTPPSGCLYATVCLEVFMCVNKCSSWWGSTIVSQVRLTGKKRCVFFFCFLFGRVVCCLNKVYYFSNSFHSVTALFFKWVITVKSAIKLEGQLKHNE